MAELNRQLARVKSFTFSFSSGLNPSLRCCLAWQQKQSHHSVVHCFIRLPLYPKAMLNHGTTQKGTMLTCLKRLLQLVPHRQENQTPISILGKIQSVTILTSPL